MAKTRHTRTRQANFPKRGEIFLTALDPTLGHEIQKTRPALIIQNDVSNRLTEMTIVAPITATVRFPLNPIHVLLAADQSTGLSIVSVAVFNQIRAVDKLRLIRKLGSVDKETLVRVDEAISISLGLLHI